MKNSTFGLDKNLACALCYLTFIAGIVFLVSEKDDKEVRFHALQSLIGGIALGIIQSILTIVLGGIPFIGGLIISLLSLANLAFYVILAVFTYQGKTIKLPVVGDLAEKHA